MTETTEIQIKQIPSLTAEEAEYLANSFEDGNGVYRVKTMTREEFNRIYCAEQQ